jgi:hypothetical protein
MMPALSEVRSESQRIGFLLRRDGYQETRKWVERTAGVYRDALGHTNHYAADPAYRPLFEKAAREFEEWLASSRD